MNTQVVLVLDTRYIKVDGTAPVIIRIIHHRASSQIKTGIYVNQKIGMISTEKYAIHTKEPNRSRD